LDLLFKRRAAPLIMGVVNVTGDSFYAGSRTPTLEAAVKRAQSLVEEGADILDVGGQSTRPGSQAVPQDEELARVVPVVEALARLTQVPISVDTDKAAVARKCRLAGASILNDVSALRNDESMARVAVDFEAVILMHRGGGSPKTMQESPAYADVVAEVKEFFEERVLAFVAAGGDRRRVLVDPGIGFGKDLGHNLSLLKHIREFSSVAPVVLGASRKSFLGRVSPDSGPEERLAGSLAAACWAAQEGVKIVRVHDVAQTRRALCALAAIREAK
jgi:dihydropteroate synthase